MLTLCLVGCHEDPPGVPCLWPLAGVELAPLELLPLCTGKNLVPMSHTGAQEHRLHMLQGKRGWVQGCIQHFKG